MVTHFLASPYDASSLPIPGINHAVAKGDRECEIPGRRRRVAEAVDRVRKRLAAGGRWIARVHLWYEDRFGYALKPYLSSADAIATFPTTATAVGVRRI